MKRNLLRLAALGVLASLPGISWGGTAFAHAAYKDSDPADESSVTRAPGEIWAEYTEPPSEGSYLRVFDPCGEQVDHGDSRPEGYRVYITLSADRAGTYRVEWFVDSSLDNHPTRGTFTFEATDGEPCPDAEPPEKDPGPRDDANTSDRASRPGVGDDSERSGDAVSTAAGDSRSSNDRHSKHTRSVERKRGNDRDDGGLVALEDPPPGDVSVPEEPGLLEGLPIGGLLLALSMSAAIGAAGGFIYAGIMGYHRVSH